MIRRILTNSNNDNKFKVIRTLWPFSRKLPVLGDMADYCIKLLGKVSNHVGKLISSTWHGLCGNLNVFSVLPKYTVSLVVWRGFCKSVNALKFQAKFGKWVHFSKRFQKKSKNS